MASSRQLLSLIDLSLDIYIIFLVSGCTPSHQGGTDWIAVAVGGLEESDIGKPLTSYQPIIGNLPP